MYFAAILENHSGKQKLKFKINYFKHTKQDMLC